MRLCVAIFAISNLLACQTTHPTPAETPISLPDAAPPLATTPMTPGIARALADLPAGTVAVTHFHHITSEMAAQRGAADRALARLAAASNGKLRVEPGTYGEPGFPTQHVTAMIDDQLRSIEVTFAVRIGKEIWSLPPGERLDEEELVAAFGALADRVAHGRKKVGVTSGLFGEERARDLIAALGDAYDAAAVEWSFDPGALAGFDAIVVNGPEHRVSDAALRALDAFVVAGKPVLFLVRSTISVYETESYEARRAENGLEPLLAAYGFEVRPALVLDAKNGIPAPIATNGGEFTRQDYFPLAQVLANRPGEVLAHANYVAMPFSSPVALVGLRGTAPQVTPILRASPTSTVVEPPVTISRDARYPTRDAGGSGEILAAAAEGSFASAYTAGAVSPAATRMIVVGGADFAGDHFHAMQEKLHLEMYGGGLRAARKMIDWLLALR